jgi:hypothetical protein
MSARVRSTDGHHHSAQKDGHHHYLLNEDVLAVLETLFSNQIKAVRI